MEFFISLMNKIWAVMPFLIAITILVFVHEWGHFWVARKNGVKVDVFSIGFGKELFGWTDKLGTRWRVSLLPLGGYVKFVGDADASSARSDSAVINTLSEEEKNQTLHSKTPLQRIAVSVAGPGANYVFAILLLAAMTLWNGVPKNYHLSVQDVLVGKIADKAGILKGDTIVQLNRQELNKKSDFVSIISSHSGEDISITVKRVEDNKTVEKSFDVPLYSVVNGEKVKEKLGVVVSQMPGEMEKASVLESFSHAFKFTWNLSIQMLKGIGELIVGKSQEVGGIFSIGAMAKQSFSLGVQSFLMFLIIISINLGLVNLLPVPVLDGGNILFATIEMIIKKPIPEKTQEFFFKIGLALIITLMLYTNYADLVRFEFFGWIKSLFFKG